jgi:hypothetical protein
LLKGAGSSFAVLFIVHALTFAGVDCSVPPIFCGNGASTTDDAPEGASGRGLTVGSIDIEIMVLTV